MRSNVLTLTRYLSGATVAAVVWVVVFNRYDRPGSIGWLLIQISVASNWSATSGLAFAAASTSPRLTSSSSLSNKVTDSPAHAFAVSPNPLTILATRLTRPDGMATIESPTRTTPDEIAPAKPR